jgi:hypothetical protein
MNAQCTLVYDLPAGHSWKTFRALCGYDSSCDTDNPNTSGTTMEFLFYVSKNEPYTFDLTQLGYSASEAVPVHDIWADEDLGTATGILTAAVPSHGVRLFRLGDKVTTGLGATPGSPAASVSDQAIYDLQGRKLSALPSASNAPLHRGLYIVGGRKVAVSGR